MRDAKKIVVLGSFPDSLINFRGPLIRAMTAAGHSVIACAPDVGPDIRAALAAIGADSRSVPLQRAGLNPIRDLVTLASLFGLFRRSRPDAVLSYTIKPVIYGSIAARLAGVPETYSMITGVGYAFGDEDGGQTWVGRLARCLYRASLSSNRKVFFQNPDDLALFQGDGLLRSPDQAVLIAGSGVDLERFGPVPLPAAASFLMIARLIREKGIYEYVEAARRLKRQYPQTRFQLVGWVDTHPAAIRERDVQIWVEEGTIEYLGRLDDVRPAIAAASVYVLPSYREGTPRTVLEAMAMGRAVITTDAPGCRETVREGWNGLLAPPRNVEALAAAMEKLITDRSLVEAMGARSRELAAGKYDARRVNEVILRNMGLA
ncbi:MAG: glycosyltransferase family 4 protein [Verrucomicrobiota bacterium]|nr:glycosyltransferase family 4 protein [Verrucomicrobiota bacterium]